ncbi:MAG: 2-oxoacid:ferredoxin oxidoreductase subunit beta, partial [Gammaproteobacteria bacterium]|nr:2-oxoacid:ferredoxin oxidoreductase subunit beta [Gammaproteobacteria bacterium]
ALEIGATFVARSFSGDKEQLVPLMQAAMSHKGFALIDVVSPCVTFNNHVGSTKSYDYTREHVEAGTVIDFVPFEKEISLKQAQGSTQHVELFNGASIQLSKLSNQYDPTSRRSAMATLMEHKANEKVLTGLIYLDPDSANFHEMLNLTKTPLNELTQDQLCPGNAALAEINRAFR